MLKNGNIKLVLGTALLFLLGSYTAKAQKLWADVQINKSSVFVGEPVQVSISVYTETWFTRGVDLGNINVNGAFTAYFRPVSISTQRERKTFSGVQLIYNVFPYSEKDIVFPALDIEVETPPVGGYKGVKRMVKTTERKIKVKPILPDFEKTGWLVATNLQVTEKWTGNKNQVRVGDVLERQITRKASGTLSELIPPTVWDSIPSVSSYPGQSSVTNFRSKTAVSSQRNEAIRYLFEKEGKVTLPEKVYTWYHPYQKKMYKRTLEAVEIEVQPNPNLGMLETVRDSLQLQQTTTKATSEGKAPKTILGLSVRDFIIVSFVLLLLGVLCFRLLKRIVRYFKKANELYKQSEAYYFNQLKQAIRKRENKEITNTFYRWIDELALNEPTYEALLNKLKKHEFKTTNVDELSISKLTLKEIKILRRDYKRIKTQIVDTTWITPQ